MSYPLASPPLSDHGIAGRYRISGSEHHFVVTTPENDRALWDAYVAGAYEEYSRHGVQGALDTVADGRDTTMFFAAVDREGTVLGGVRIRGPYASVDETHAISEWAGMPGEERLRKQITDRLPFGVVEVKTAWVSRGPNSRDISDAIARTTYPTARVLGIQFQLATASAHILDRWTSTGMQISADIPAVPYPTPQDGTRVIWWNRQTFLRSTDPEQAPKMVRETAELMRSMQPPSDRRVVALG